MEVTPNGTNQQFNSIWEWYRIAVPDKKNLLIADEQRKPKKIINRCKPENDEMAKQKGCSKAGAHIELIPLEFKE